MKLSAKQRRISPSYKKPKQHKGNAMTKITEQKNGAYTTFERLFPSGMYLVMLYSTRGEVMDKIRCDTYRAAREYLAAFNRIAKAQ